MAPSLNTKPDRSGQPALSEAECRADSRDKESRITPKRVADARKRAYSYCVMNVGGMLHRGLRSMGNAASFGRAH
jgi:hypothetical protein